MSPGWGVGAGPDHKVPSRKEIPNQLWESILFSTKVSCNLQKEDSSKIGKYVYVRLSEVIYYFICSKVFFEILNLKTGVPTKLYHYHYLKKKARYYINVPHQLHIVAIPPSPHYTT